MTPACHGGGAQPVLQDGFGLGELRLGVDTPQIVLLGFDGDRLQTHIAGDGNRVGQVIFPLVIVIADGLEDRQRVLAGERHQAAVAEGDRALGSARVALLADGDQCIAFNDEPAVTGRIGRSETQNGNRCPFGQRAAQRRQDRRPHQRRIGEHHQDVVRLAGDGFARRQNGMGGAEPFRLHEDLRLRGDAARFRGDFVLTGPHHHRDLFGAGLPRRAQHMRQQAAVTDLMHGFRARGAHADALAGRQHNRKAGSAAHRVGARLSGICCIARAPHSRGAGGAKGPPRHLAVFKPNLIGSVNVSNNSTRQRMGMASSIVPPQQRLTGPSEATASGRGLWRAGGWGLAAAVSLAAVAVVTQTDVGKTRLQDAVAQAPALRHVFLTGYVPQRPLAKTLARPVAVLPAHTADNKAEMQRLETAVRTLTADRDRLAGRLASLEQNLDDMTGSIKAVTDATAAARAATDEVKVKIAQRPPAAPPPVAPPAMNFPPIISMVGASPPSVPAAHASTPSPAKPLEANAQAPSEPGAPAKQDCCTGSRRTFGAASRAAKIGRGSHAADPRRQRHARAGATCPAGAS